jgi:hypothetical protein
MKSDSGIERDVRPSGATQSSISNRIVVEADGGMVTLKGTVRS